MALSFAGPLPLSRPWRAEAPAHLLDRRQRVQGAHIRVSLEHRHGGAVDLVVRPLSGRLGLAQGTLYHGLERMGLRPRAFDILSDRTGRSR